MHMSNARLAVDEGSLLWTLEEIGRLVSQSGNPAETLTNIVHLIQRRFETDVCSVYLLEPDRANLVLAATIGLRPESVGRVRMRLTRRARRARRRSSCSRRSSPTRRGIRASSTFSEAGEDPYRSFLGVPIIDRGLLQGVLVVQTIEPRAFSAGRRADAGDGRRAARADRQRSAHARPVRRAGAPAAVGARAEPLVELGRRHDAACSASSIRRCGASCDNNPIALLAADSDRQARGARVAARAAQPHQLRLPPDAGVPELDAHLGRAARRRAVGAAGRVLLGRVRPARIAADLLRRPRHPRGRSHQERVRPRHPARRRRPLLRPGLFPAAARRDGWQHEDYIDVDSRLLPIEPATTPTASRSIVTIETRTGTIAARVWKLAVGRNTLLLLDSNVEGNQPEDRELTARLYGGDDRVRIRQELLLGVGGVRALAALGISPGVVHLNEGHSAFAALELVRQRMAARRHRRRRSAPARRRRRSSSRRTRRCRPGTIASRRTLIEEHLGPLRDALGHRPRSASWASGASIRTTTAKTFCMTVLALKLVAPRQRRVVAARPGVARDVDAALSRRRARSSVPIGHITNGVHVPTLARAADAPGLRPAPRPRLAAARAASRDSGKPSTTSTTASCGRRIRR